MFELTALLLLIGIYRVLSWLCYWLRRCCRLTVASNQSSAGCWAFI